MKKIELNANKLSKDKFLYSLDKFDADIFLNEKKDTVFFLEPYTKSDDDNKN